jgi:hypothetical protein
MIQSAWRTRAGPKVFAIKPSHTPVELRRLAAEEKRAMRRASRKLGVVHPTYHRIEHQRLKLSPQKRTNATGEQHN